MSINTTNTSFKELTGELCRLNYSSKSSKANSKGAKALDDKPEDKSSNASSNSGSNNMLFDGFQNTVGERFSLSNDQTTQLLEMFVDVLTDLINAVISDLSNDDGNGSEIDSEKDNETNSEPLSSTIGNGGNNPGTGYPTTGTNGSSTGNVETTSTIGNGDNNLSIGYPTIGAKGSGAEGVETTPSETSSGGCPYLAAGGGNPEPTQENKPSGESNPLDSKPSGESNPLDSKPSGESNPLDSKPSGESNPLGSKPNGENNSVDPADNRAIDFSTLSTEERSDMGLSNRERAIVHLWGRQMISDGKQNGGIYSNVLGPDGSGSGWENKAEVALIKELRETEKNQFGGDTGWMLDQMFFEIMDKKNGSNMSERYANRPVNFSKGSIDITNDIKTLSDRTGINEFEQGVMRLLGHDALMDGQFDGSVLEYTLNNENSLDSNKHSQGNNIDENTKKLLSEDLQDDGIRNGSSILNHTQTILDRLYS